MDLSSYFDFNDIKNPVHQYLQDFNIYAFIPNLTQTTMYRIKRNEGTLNDDIWVGVQGKADEVDFYSVRKDNYLIGPIDQDQVFLQINFSLDVQVDQYQRTVFSFLDLFGFIGGLFQIFKMFGFIFVFYFANKSFYCSVLSKLWKTEEQMKQFKYSSKIDIIGKEFKDAEENKSSVGIRAEQNSIVPSQIIKVEISDNKISSQNIHEEIKFNDNFNLQSMFDSNRIDTQFKKSVNSLFWFTLVWNWIQ